MEKQNLTFSQVLEDLKLGYAVARRGWNGEGMYLKLFKPNTLVAETAQGIVTEKEYLSEGDKELPVAPAIYIKTADNKFIPWSASQADLLANDWIAIERLDQYK